MNRPANRAKLVLCAILAIAWPLCGRLAGAAEAEANGIRIVRLEGTVEVAPAGGSDWILTQTNQLLVAHWKLRTGPNSRVSLLWSDRSVVSFGAHTEIEILPPQPNRGEGLNLLKGLLWFFHRDTPGRIRVETRGASASVEGTEFVLSTGPESAPAASELSVLDGIVRYANEQGSLVVTNGQQAQADLGTKPRFTAGFIANHVLQWALYYPAVLDLNDLPSLSPPPPALANSLAAYASGDLLAALAAYPENHPPASDAERLYHAALLLSVGQVAETEAELSLLSNSESSERIKRLATALRTLIAAVKHEARPQSFAPELPTEYLAASYYEQSRATGDESLQTALQLARAAATRAPNFGFAYARVAELELSFGERDRARSALNWAQCFTPRNAAALTMQGFLLALENQPATALAYFNQALAVDSALGNAWLGRGLARIRQGDLPGGREDLLIAAATEPQRALFRSYLAKAYAETDLPDRAAHELELSKQLDRNDPTVWLYSALIHHQQDQINVAIHDLERSQQLNDNRALFRSQLLLDQDQAVRSANLAAVYRDAGMAEVGRREAAKAVTYDYADSSGHLFMSDSFNELRDPTLFNLRYETVWFNELLLANLLAPVGAARLSQTLGRMDYFPLFESDHLGGASATSGRSDGQLQQLASQFGVVGNTAWALDLNYQHQDGVRRNNQLEQFNCNATIKQQLTPNDSALLLVGYQHYDSGDNFQYYDPAQARPAYSFKEEQLPMLAAGYHHEWSPGVDTLVLAGRLVSQPEFRDQDVAQWRVRHGSTDRLLSDLFDVSYLADLEVYSAELNQIVRTKNLTLVAGGLAQGGDISARDYWLETSQNSVFPVPAAAGSFREPYRRMEGYSYVTLEPFDRCWLTGGLSYDHIEHPVDFQNPPLAGGTESRNLLGPKAALVWNPFAPVTLRGIYSRSLGGFSLDQSFRLEPAQLAGFPQAFRTVISESLVGSVTAPEHEVFGLALDLKFPTGTYLGLELDRINSDVRRTLGIFRTDANVSPAVTSPATTPEALAYQEDVLALSLNQTVGRGLALGLRYQLTDAELANQLPELAPLDPSLQQQLHSRLHQLSAYARFNHPSGCFTRLDVSYYRQANDGDSVAQPGDSFVQLNWLAGYHLARRRAAITFGILNLTDTNYRLSPLTYYAELPRERVYFGGLTFQF